MHNLGHLAQRVFNTPVAIHPGKAEVIVAALADRFGLAAIQLDRRASIDDDEGGFSEGRAEADRGYDVVGPVAIIPVLGTLVHKSAYLRPYSGITGYNSIRTALLSALRDPNVKGIVFDIDSPGGECAGLFDLCDTIFAARREKPMCAILSENAYSAGYAIASCAPKLYVPRTGGTGSIGVICMHVDYSKWLAKEGIAVTLIQYGARKADGTQFKPLTDKALQSFQADIDTLGGMFDQLVARNRKLQASRIKSYEAGTFMGARGVTAGLADAVMAPDEAIRTFIKSL